MYCTDFAPKDALAVVTRIKMKRTIQFVLIALEFQIWDQPPAFTIPNRYTQIVLLEDLSSKVSDVFYDFVYLPMNF